MKNLVVLTYATDGNHPGFTALMRSITKMGLSFDIEGLDSPKEYKGWGTKMLWVYRMLERNRGSYSHFVAVDGYDTVFMRRPDAIMNYDFLISGEQGCYPDADLAEMYPKTTTPYRFVNAGTYGGQIDYVLDMFRANGLHQVDPSGNDQRDLTRCYLANQDLIKIDTCCEVFQTMAFADPGDFSVVKSGVINNITGTYPAIWHGNARVDMNWLYQLV